ncbi:MAG: geranylgeranylglycerol-phosphate geranylgeranyltransferase [Bacteroidales bacterium]
MKPFLKLIRWQNLVIIILTQFLMRYAILGPVTGLINVTMASTGTVEPLSLQLPLVDFIILVLSTVFIAAGGYVINDYFDIRTDLINRGEVIVGARITRRKAMMWHNILNIAGVAAGFYISYRVGYFWIGIIFLIVSGLLYFYSATYKRQLLIGNLVVAVMTAMVPLMVLAFEIPMIYNHYLPLVADMPSLKVPALWVLGFSAFAFITTLAREIIKDMEDFEGDMAYGSKSLPVVAGLKVSKVVVATLQIITMLLIFSVWKLYLSDTYTLVYAIVLIIIPLSGSIYLLISGRDKKAFYMSSLFMKIVMLSGILYSLLVYIIIEKGLVG